MSRLLILFVKLTGYPVQFFYYRKKVFCENENKELKNIKGAALIISNHNTVLDFPLIMYTFFWRTIRPLVAEIISEMNHFMGHFMKGMGGIFVDRHNFDFSFMQKAIEVLKKNQICLIFPESKVPDDRDSIEFMDFKPSYVYISLESGAPIVPVYINGSYGKVRKKRHENAEIMIGEKIYPRALIDSTKTEKENIEYINDYVKNYIYDLRKKLQDIKNGK